MKQIESAFQSRILARKWATGLKQEAAVQVTTNGVGMDSNLRNSGSSTHIHSRARAAKFAFAVAAIATSFAATTLVTLLTPPQAAAQSSYTAQLSGVVSDSSGGVIPGAKVTLTDEGTGVASTLSTDERGIFVFTGIRPSTYTVSASADGLNSQERKGVVLAVSQQANL